jgi:hypothetical protein
MPKAAEVEEDAVKKSTKAAEAAIETQVETMKGAMALPQEMAKLYARRFQRDIQTMEALTRCRTPADVVDVWSDAARDAVRDCQEGATLMLEASMNGASGVQRPKP